MEYRVTVKGMFIDGTLHRKGDTFTATDEKAKAMLELRPRQTFEEVTNDKDKSNDPLGRHGGKDDSAGNARLYPDSGKGKDAKKSRPKLIRK